MHKILALAQNVGGLPKYMRQMYAAIVCRNSRHLSRTVPAVVPARLVKISALCPISAGAYIFSLFPGENQKPISASKCPITALKIRT